MGEEKQDQQLEEFKVTFKNGALKNLQRLATHFKTGDDLERIVAKATKLLTFVQDAKNGRVFWENDKGERYVVDIDNL